MAGPMFFDEDDACCRIQEMSYSLSELLRLQIKKAAAISGSLIVVIRMFYSSAFFAAFFFVVFLAAFFGLSST